MRSLWSWRYSLGGIRARTSDDRRNAAFNGIAVLLALSLYANPGSAISIPVGTPSSGSDVSVADLADSLEDCTASLSDADRWQLASIIRRESQEQGYDPLFLVAIIQVESGCAHDARGPGGGVGLTQIQPTTARQVARSAAIPWHGEATLTRPGVNVALGVGYLVQLEARFNDPLLAMAAYNMGPGRVARMSPRRARKAAYVRRVLTRYEGLVTH